MGYIEMRDLYNSKIELLLGKLHYKTNEDLTRTLVIFEELVQLQEKKIELFRQKMKESIE